MTSAASVIATCSLLEVTFLVLLKPAFCHDIIELQQRLPVGTTLGTLELLARDFLEMCPAKLCRSSHRRPSNADVKEVSIGQC